MSYTCGACNGTGECQNEHHAFIDAFLDAATMGVNAGPCPACGQEAGTPGNCSVCGGEGEQDD